MRRYLPEWSGRKSERLAVLLLVTVYLGSRLINLLSLPRFNDEALDYLWGIQRTLNEPIMNGKWLTPQLWAITAAYPVDALFVNRLLNGFAGLLTLLCLVQLGSALRSFRLGLFAAAFYTAFPFALFNSRLAEADNFYVLAGAAILWLSVKIYRSQHPALIAFLLVLAFTGGLLSKVSSIVFLAIPVLTLLLYSPRQHNRVVFWLFVVMMASASIAVLSFALGYGIFQFAIRNADFLPAANPLANIVTFGQWMIGYFTLPFGVCVVIAFIYGLRKHYTRFLILALLLTSLPVFLSSTTVPRYYLFVVVPLALLVADFLLDALRRRSRLSVLITLMVMVPVFIFDGQIMFDIAHSPLPSIDRWQYVTGWPSGYGYTEMNEFLRNTAMTHPIRVVVSDVSGYPRPALLLDFANSPSVIVDVRPPGTQQLRPIDSLPTYLVLARPVDSLIPDCGTLIWTYQRAMNESSLEIWHIDDCRS